MLIAGELNCIPDVNGLVVLNFSSFAINLPKVDLIPPGQLLMMADEREFDISYANAILNDNYNFMELMKIVMPLYEGKDVYLALYREPRFDSIAESLLKFIQQRYGYNYQLINELDDFNPYDSSEFSVFGLTYLDQDKERFNKIVYGGLV